MNTLPAGVQLHAEPCEPPFLGTGEVLVWSTESLLAGIDHDRLFKQYWGGASLSSDAYDSARTADFEPSLQRFTSLILSEEVIDPRGFYGFFPVITDGDTLVVLDSSDYCTERAVCAMARTSDEHHRSLVDYLRPEGDMLPVLVSTIGGVFARHCAGVAVESPDRVRLEGIGRYLVNDLARRLSIEIRRALLLPNGLGSLVLLGEPGTTDFIGQGALLDLLCADERLGITAGDSSLEPVFSSLGVFLRNPPLPQE